MTAQTKMFLLFEMQGELDERILEGLAKRIPTKEIGRFDDSQPTPIRTAPHKEPKTLQDVYDEQD